MIKTLVRAFVVVAMGLVVAAPAVPASAAVVVHHIVVSPDGDSGCC